MSQWSLSQLLSSLHEDIQQRLSVVRKTFGHPGTKGDASENVWIDMLDTYLPKRYQAAKAHVVVSVDAVPAFDTGDQYEIPDTASGKWIKTDPEIHKDKATAAHQAYGNEWKGLVRMVKYWNNNPKHGDQKPVKPSFLIEVMALECLYGGWGGSFDREIQSFFATLADRVHDEWPDPAGLGPAISNDMDAARKQRAQQLLFQASQDASIAIDHARRGRNIEALRAWRALFGPKFPLS